MRGIDISNWQTGITPSELGIDFCIVKATEGLNFIDGTCGDFIQDCIANDILWGFYHFARNNEPEAEAQFFYDNCRNYFNHGIPVLDYEVSNYNNREWCERFLKKLHELSGVWAIIYLSASRCGEYEGSWIPEKCGLWVAGYPMPYTDWIDSDPTYNIYPFKFAAIWQFTSSLKLGDWNVDGDIAYMDSYAWMQYAQSTTEPQIVEKSKNSGKSVDDLALETYLGEYGNGEDRKRALGSRYQEVQDRVNEAYRIADEVIAGNWGNGWNRRNALEGAGYSYDLIQRIVNDKLN